MTRGAAFSKAAGSLEIRGGSDVDAVPFSDPLSS